jgi:excisionase family DNA binding protein
MDEETDMNQDSGLSVDQDRKPSEPTPSVEGLGGDQLLFTVPEAADVLRMSRAKLYELMRRGQVLSVLIGGSRRVPRAAVLTYIRELTEAAEREQAERRHADQQGAVDWRSSWSRFGLDRPA